MKKVIKTTQHGFYTGLMHKPYNYWSGSMRPLIEFCMNNLTSDVLEIKKKLDQDFDLDVLEYDCLGNCGICAQGAYALVNGEIVTGKTAKELLENIYRTIEETEYHY